MSDGPLRSLTDRIRERAKRLPGRSFTPGTEELPMVAGPAMPLPAAPEDPPAPYQDRDPIDGDAP